MLTVDITREFVTAGKAIFTVANPAGEHYTYRVTRKDPTGDFILPVYFVSVLTGGDNTSDYTYLGCLAENSGRVRLTRASKFTEDSKAFKVLNWALSLVWASKALPDGYAARSEGRCCCCGRMLTHPDGVMNDGFRFGFGPVCWEKRAG